MDKKAVETIRDISIATGYLLDKFDELERTGKVNQVLKTVTNRFKRELTKLELIIADGADVLTVDQLVESYQMFDNLLDLSSKIKPDDIYEFTKELNQLTNKYRK